MKPRASDEQSEERVEGRIIVRHISRKMKKKAVVLLSGGIDSATTLFIAKERGYKCYPLLFDYGQRHKKELVSARKIAAAALSDCTMLKIALPWKGSALVDRTTPLAKKRPQASIGMDIPASYVPARNTIFLSFALGFAEAIGARSIFIGANAVDFAGYPDCREDYINAFEAMARKGTRAGQEGKAIRIEAPLLKMTKPDIILEAKRLGVPFGLTWSCYEGGRAPCGECDSCAVRIMGFKKAGMRDPGVYEKRRRMPDR